MIKLGPFVHLVNQKARLKVPYNMALMAVLRGDVPATLQGGRWMVDSAHVEAAAAFFDTQRRNCRSAGERA